MCLANWRFVENEEGIEVVYMRLVMSFFLSDVCCFIHVVIVSVAIVTDL